MHTGDLRIARRYATALFRVAVAHDEVDDVAKNLALVTSTAAASPELLAVLHHPLITRQRKKELLGHVFQASIRPDVEHFLFILVEKDRASIIVNVAQEFERLVREYRRQIDAEVVSAVELTPAQQEALLQRLQTATGYTVTLKARVDESILGGLVIRIGDHLVDGSIATQLQTVREQLKQVKVT